MKMQQGPGYNRVKSDLVGQVMYKFVLSSPDEGTAVGKPILCLLHF